MLRLKLTGLIQGIGVALVGAVVIAESVHDASPRECEAVVHVTERGVDVNVDNRRYRVDSYRQTPLVCELSPGAHRLTMSRGGVVLHDEHFHLERGEETVLTAWRSRPEQGADSALTGESPDECRAATASQELGCDVDTRAAATASMAHFGVSR